MRRRHLLRGRALPTVAGLLLALTVTACAGRTDTIEPTVGRPTPVQSTATPAGPVSGSAVPSDVPEASPSGDASAADDPGRYAVPDPGPLESSLLTADVLVTSSRPIPATVRSGVRKVRGVAAAMPLSVASLSANGRTLLIAAADPAQFRRFTAPVTAEADDVWARVAGGEVAVDVSLPRRIQNKKGYLQLGSSTDSPQVHIGAYAPLVKQISAVVDYKRGDQLGIPRDNALLVSTGQLTPSAVMDQLKRVLGPGPTVQTLALEFNVDVQQTALLTGSSVSDAVGTFTYTPHADGTLTPDSRWVSSYIRQESVPILGSVTCNKGMLPQLRAALTEVVQRGLADKIHPGEYAGCYYPRFIARDPAKGISLHSWGIAVDLNVPGNQRGTVGEMDRQVVQIFKKWGFAWGGDWSYTDPMHFEMASVVAVR
jgi:hypothetical protein